MKLILLTLATMFVFGTTLAQTPKPFRIGVAGLTHTHVHWLLDRADDGDFEIVGIAEPNRELAERFLKQYRDQLQASFVMGVGGSFDVYGGKVARAPRLVQKLGLEWLFRVLQEPRRLWRRYFETNTAYAALLWREIRTRRHTA